jgi:hypothetical protein
MEMMSSLQCCQSCGEVKDKMLMSSNTKCVTCTSKARNAVLNTSSSIRTGSRPNKAGPNKVKSGNPLPSLCPDTQNQANNIPNEDDLRDEDKEWWEYSRQTKVSNVRKQKW